MPEPLKDCKCIDTQDKYNIHVGIKFYIEGLEHDIEYVKRNRENYIKSDIDPDEIINKFNKRMINIKETKERIENTPECK